MINRWTKAAAGACAAMALAACSSNPAATTPTSPAAQQAGAAVSYALLEAYHWDLDAAYDGAGRALPQFKALEPQTRVQLNFMAGEGGRHTVTTKVCNQMMGSYELNGQSLKVSRLVSTMMACMGDGLSQLERAVGAQLNQTQSVQLLKPVPQPQISVSFRDGSRWQLSGKPTDATRFGNAGETMFLEVASETKPCTNGNMRTQCLQVREVRYDASSRKSYASDWQHFYQPIEGFTHKPGLRHVLRIKRYEVPNPPADASRFAYVLDMAVETEIVKR